MMYVYIITDQGIYNVILYSHEKERKRKKKSGEGKTKECIICVKANTFSMCFCLYFVSDLTEHAI